MARLILEEQRLHPSIRDVVASLNQDIVSEVEAAVQANPVVLVGMAQNPFPKKARKALDERSVQYVYLEYGNYFKDWRRRNALKMWSGWPTFPMVFVKGQLIGGYKELHGLLENGEFKALLGQ